MGERPIYKHLEQQIKELKKEATRCRAAEEELRMSKEILSQIVQGNTIPTFVIDNQHRITHCNRAFENLTGIAADEIIGTHKQWMAFYSEERPVMADFIVDKAPADELARYYGKKYQKSAVSEGAYEAESFFPNLGENGKWVFFTAAPLKDAEGNVTGAIETLQDISERKRAEETVRRSERRLRALLDFLPYPTVVFTRRGRVFYLNPEFTSIFGWTLEELEEKTIPYVPPDLEQETSEMINRLFEERILQRYETKRLTKDGRILDVVMRAVVYSVSKDEPAGEIVIFRDITREKRIARNNEAILRISTALPEYPDLEDLLDYISNEIKRLLGTEGSLVTLLDEEKDDLYFLGAAYDDTAAEKRVKKIRFPVDQLMAGKVIRSGEPVIVSNTFEEPYLQRERDKKLGYQTKNLLLVPLRSGDRIIGVLCAINKKEGDFDQTDVELLSMIAGTVVLSVENARFSEDIITEYRTNNALLRISTALPKYPELGELLDYISNEVKRLIDTEGALVILLDEEKEELFILGSAYDDTTTQKRVKEIRFSMDQLMAARVIKSGEPLIVSDTSEDAELHRERDKKLGYQTKNLLLVPLRSSDRIIGVLCAINKKEVGFGQIDVERLSMMAGTVALSIENARFSHEIKKAYKEVSSMNRAKDKVINHISHEIKTPVSVLSPTLNILARKLEGLPEETWKPAIERGQRNLERILEIQYEVDDIMQDRQYKTHDTFSLIFDECADELEALIAEEVGEGKVIERIRKRIDEIFGPKDLIAEKMLLTDYVQERLKDLKSLSSHRKLEIISRLEPAPPIYIPRDPLKKVIDGIVKNAIENTPDEGKIEVSVHNKEKGAELVVRDYGVGITKDHQRRIFEGFFATQETLDYSSKTPFDFNAGGKGADLLRMKIFSKRYGFKVDMVSSRCRFIPKASDVCPGNISECKFCTNKKDCHNSGGTTFSLYFPPAP
ncbi:MAG: GAF domain-containing protein [Deltaproteobacteria bacterium]|nr:GAF domain-containing protein [Deltaproteobacteria bacterium]